MGSNGSPCTCRASTASTTSHYNGRTDARRLTYGDVFLQAEQEYSRFNFEYADTKLLHQHFIDAEEECKALLEQGLKDGRHEMALPAYDQCIKASHVFNLLDARGVISVTERQSYILRVRELAKACCAAWLKTAGGRRLMHPDTLGGLILGIPALIIAFFALWRAARGVLLRRGADPRRCGLSGRDRRRCRRRAFRLGHGRLSEPMQLESYSGKDAPPQAKALALRPKLVAWSSRVWRESPERAVPLFKLEARLELRDIEDKALAEALHPFASPAAEDRHLSLASRGDATAGVVGSGAVRRRCQGRLHVLP